MATDYYELLGVSKDASKEEIKKAYRKKAIQYHPDKNKGDTTSENKFKEVSAAYAVLSDEQQRSQYDRFGAEAFQQHQRQGGGAGGGPFSGFSSGNFNFQDIFGDFDDSFGGDSIFDTLFGGRGRSGGRRQKGSNLKYAVTMTLEESFNGKTLELDLKKNESCSTCGGSGAKSGSSPTTCPDCNGEGQVRQNRGIFSINSPCHRCQGKGTIISNPCTTCNGSGIKKVKKRISVKIPPGIDDGQSIKKPGEGEAITGGVAGDLFLQVSIKPHEFFHREDNILYCEIPISITQAVLGEIIKVSTIDNKQVKIKIQPGTQHGSVLRVRGEGMPDVHSGRRGDMHIKILINIPTKLASKERQLYEQLENINKSSDSPKPKRLNRQGFF